MNCQYILVCLIVVINIIGFKCSVWDSTQDVLPKGTLKQFRKLLRTARHIVVITGAGISTDSGIMTYRGSWGYWRKWSCRELDTSTQFKHLSTVGIAWEFNNFRRDYLLIKKPNVAHYAIVELEKYLEEEGKGRKLSLITLNTDGLHTEAGSKNIIELFGTVWKTECTACGNVEYNRDNPICPALAQATTYVPQPRQERSDMPYFLWVYHQRMRAMFRREFPKIVRRWATIDANEILPPPDPRDLPHCKQPHCKRMLRPYITLLDEDPKFQELVDATDIINDADLVITVGVSFSNASLVPLVFNLNVRNVPVAEFNIQKTCATSRAEFHFRGLSKFTLPPALNLSDTWDL